MTRQNSSESSFLAIGAKHRPSSFQAVVEAVIDFANGKAKPPLEGRFQYGPMPGGSLDEGTWVKEIPSDTEIPVDVPITLAEAKKIARGQIEDEQLQCGDWLLRVLRAKSPQAAAAEIALASQTPGLSAEDELSFGYPRVSLLPEIEVKSGKISISIGAVGPSNDHRPWTYLAIALIGANYDGIREQIFFCHLAGCRNIWLAEQGKTGAPRMKYCCPRHLQDAHKATATERVRLSRERRREAAKTKTTRRKK